MGKKELSKKISEIIYNDLVKGFEIKNKKYEIHKFELQDLSEPLKINIKKRISIKYDLDVTVGNQRISKLFTYYLDNKNELTKELIKESGIDIVLYHKCLTSFASTNCLFTPSMYDGFIYHRLLISAGKERFIEIIREIEESNKKRYKKTPTYKVRKALIEYAKLKDWVTWFQCDKWRPINGRDFIYEYDRPLRNYMITFNDLIIENFAKEYKVNLDECIKYSDEVYCKYNLRQFTTRLYGCEREIYDQLKNKKTIINYLLK